MKDLPFDGKYPLYYLKWALFWTNWEYEEGKPIGKRYKKLSKMVKDREIAHLTPQPYAQETLLVALFSLALVLALPCPGSWKVFLLSPKANSFLSFKILDTFWLPHFPTPSLLPMSPQIDLWYKSFGRHLSHHRHHFLMCLLHFTVSHLREQASETIDICTARINSFRERESTEAVSGVYFSMTMVWWGQGNSWALGITASGGL